MAIKLKNTDLKIVKGNTPIKSVMLGDKTIYGVTIQGPYIFSMYTNEASLTGLTETGKKLPIINIPKSYNGFPVVDIGDYAFKKCTELTSVTIPTSVRSIGYEAFDGCIGLTSIAIPINVTKIGKYAVYKRDSIYCEAVSKPGGWNSEWIYNQYATVVWGHNNITTNNDYDYVLHDDEAYLTKYKGAETVATIPSTIGGKTVVYFGDIFSGNLTVTSVTIPNSVTSIESEAFDGCSGLTSIIIGSGVTSIRGPVFYYCKSLTSITVDEANTTYASHQGILMNKAKTEIIFVPKSIKGDIVLPNTLTSIGDSAFSGCSGLTSITIPNSVTSIGSSAFSGCSGLTSITIPNSVTSIGEHVFANCINLTSIAIPHSVTTIGASAFINTAWLNNQPDGLVYTGRIAYVYKGTMPQNTAITLRDDTTEIQGRAFENCTGLTSITIPNSVTTIKLWAFKNCKMLSAITIPNTVTTLDDGIFEGCSGLTSITLPFVGSTLGGASKTHFGYIFGASDYNDNAKYVPASLRTVVITGGEFIGYAAFMECANLNVIVIPNSVTQILRSAFAGCSNIHSFTIPESVKFIGEQAFYSCNYLSQIYCKAPSQPSEWDINWKYGCKATVVWGYKGA